MASLRSRVTREKREELLKSCREQSYIVQAAIDVMEHCAGRMTNVDGRAVDIDEIVDYDHASLRLKQAAAELSRAAERLVFKYDDGGTDE